MNIKETAKALYQSSDFFIKYSAGKPIACHPFYAGGSYMSMGAEKPCNDPQEAKQVLRNVAMRHALELKDNEEWEI